MKKAKQKLLVLGRGVISPVRFKETSSIAIQIFNAAGAFLAASSLL
jgi:hypothetical protein